MSLNELASVMHAAPVPVLATDDNGYYVYRNEAARRFLGYELVEIVGKHLTDLIAYDRQLIMTTFERLKRRGFYSGRARYRHAEGSLREADVNIFGQTFADEKRVFVSLAHPRPGVGDGLPKPQTIFDLGLTDAEMRLLQLLADGFLDAQVARLIGVEEGAINQQVEELLKKLRASSRTDAVVLALKKRIIL